MAMVKAKFNRGKNIKMGDGIDSWSTLFGDDEYYIPELDTIVKGTCGNHCKGCKGKCYVRKSYRYKTVKLSHARNTLAMRNDIEKCYTDLYNQIKRARKPFYIIRVDQSGEIENNMQFGMFCKLAKAFPKVKFYIYTKAYDIIIPYLLNGFVPENFTVLVSVWHEYGIEEYKSVAHLENVKAFVYMDGFDYAAHGLEVQTMCNAYDENGKMDHNITCDKCKKCFNRLANCKVIGCYDH